MREDLRIYTTVFNVSLVICHCGKLATPMGRSRLKKNTSLPKSTKIFVSTKANEHGFGIQRGAVVACLYTLNGSTCFHSTACRRLLRCKGTELPQLTVKATAAYMKTIKELYFLLSWNLIAIRFDQSSTLYDYIGSARGLFLTILKFSSSHHSNRKLIF